MSAEGRILIVDDDPDFVASYREFLTAEGYAVDVAQSEKEARRRFEEPGWGVIVIDQKLRGPGGPDEGLDLAAVAMRKAPDAKVIIATAYAEPASIARAFDLGVYDYLQKDQFFEPFLRAKVRNAMEVWRERALTALSAEKREQEIAEAWKAARAEPDRQRKGERGREKE
jgi:DNA-binding NtrC family response regulator